MGSQSAFSMRGRNPDVLSCIASLSNDEVFTPPELANRMLDEIAASWARQYDGADIWADKDVRFLDPCTKSGVFLREITRRLTAGLATQIPDLTERVNHILQSQVFGIAITELTGLLSRRSLYCSKLANGENSIFSHADSSAGNIWFERLLHTWSNDRCCFCGAGRSSYSDSLEFETHAYTFIHRDAEENFRKGCFGESMQFDVIIGNPPYQLDDGGHGASAVPIYDKFVENAKKLEPRLLSMVIPARWFFGGRGLDSFRSRMLSDSRIRTLVDYPDSRNVFQGVDVAGGICYFLWERDNPGACRVVSMRDPNSESIVERPLLEPGASVFIRTNEAIPILKKVMAAEGSTTDISLPRERKFDRQVSGQKPFGLRTFFRGKRESTSERDLVVLQSGGKAYVSRSEIDNGIELIDKWKVFTSKSSAEHAGQVDKNGMRKVLSLSGVIPPGTVVTETYILLGCFDDEASARNCYSYVTSRFFRFLVATRSSGQDLPRAAYEFVPLQSFDVTWDDQSLYLKYGLDQAEIDLIESLIRPMDAKTDG